MKIKRIKASTLAVVLKYRDDMRGMMSIELVLVLPILFFAVLGTLVYTDAYRARAQAQMAALHVADLISRNTVVVTADYLEGMNNVFDFLNTRNMDTRLRISSITWDKDTETPEIVWSYGTRGLISLMDISAAAHMGDGGSEVSGQPENDGFGFDNPQMQLPVAGLAQRIPPVFPGEALILVEAFSLWRSPIVSLMGISYLDNIRMTPIAVTRPRFAPFIRFEGDNGNFPSGDELEAMAVADDEEEPVAEDEASEPPGTTVTVVDMDFTDGDTTGWSTETVTHSSVAGIGSFLGRFGGETRQNPINFDVNLGGVSSSALIEFDLFIIDSWDGYRLQYTYPEGDAIILKINGSAIAFEAFDYTLTGESSLHANSRSSNASRAEGRFLTTMELVQSGTNLWGNHFTDQIWRVRIEVTNPSTTFTLGISANLDSPISNESFGIANMRVTTTLGNHGEQGFVADSDLLQWQDSYTEFKMYAGCPEPRFPAVNLTFRNSDIKSNQQLEMLRRARGTTWASECDGLPNNRLVVATPTAVLHYTNDTPNQDGHRLRLRTEDGNTGFTCDSTLLVQDPHGQWHSRNRISAGVNHNARIDFGHAATGTYYIWIGTFQSGECDTKLRFSKY